MINLYLTTVNGQDEHAVGAALARFALYDTYASAVPLKKDERGKPYFEGHTAHISISHSSGMCLAAISDDEIGADIEFITHSEDRLIPIAKRYFTALETEYVLRSPIKHFYEIWCAKESYIKYTGEGLSRSLSSFCVLESDMHFTHFILNGYHIAVCAKKRADTPPIVIDADKLYQC